MAVRIIIELFEYRNRVRMAINILTKRSMLIGNTNKIASKKNTIIRTSTASYGKRTEIIDINNKLKRSAAHPACSDKKYFLVCNHLISVR
jgi:hypothetical protein